MKPERLLLLLVWLALAAGFVVWMKGGADALQHVSARMWLGAFGLLCLPLVVWLAYFVWKRGR